MNRKQILGTLFLLLYTICLFSFGRVWPWGIAPFLYATNCFPFVICFGSYGQFVLVLCISNLYSLFFPFPVAPQYCTFTGYDMSKVILLEFSDNFSLSSKNQSSVQFFLTNIMDLQRYSPKKTIFKHHYQEEFQELIIMFCTFCSREAPLN